MAFYSTNDLLVRRVTIAKWLSDQTKKLKNHSFYGELLSCNSMQHIQYVSACLEAIECYEAITDDDEDGVNNCLTEAQLDNIFKNIQILTGLCFPDKGFTYNSNEFSNPSGTSITTFSGVTLVTQENETIILSR